MVKTGLKYNEAVVGEVLGCSVTFATKSAFGDYARVTEDMDPLYWQEEAARAEGYDGVVAPSGFHLQYTAMKFAIGQDLYVPQGSVHVKQRYRLYQEVLAGDCLTTTVCISEKYIKKGRKYLTYRCTVTNQRDEVVAVSDMTNILAEEVTEDEQSADV